MNYIKHLSGFFEKVVLDYDFNPTHISLYIAIFQAWNQNRFVNPINISRDELMRISKTLHTTHIRAAPLKFLNLIFIQNQSRAKKPKN
jgi:hypothetical protein